MNNIGKKLLKLYLGLGAFAAAALPQLAVFASEEAAETSGNTQQGSGWQMWVVLLIYIGVFVLIGYFLIFRPQKKRKKEEEEMRSSLTLGSEVTTIGGITGKVVSIKDDNVTIETSLDRTLFEVKNWAIREIKKLETDDDKN